MIDHNHFICHFIFGGHLLNIPRKAVPNGIETAFRYLFSKEFIWR